MGDHLRKRRRELGLLQKQVAERIGADVASIVNWEKGNTSPAIRFIPAIIAFLGYDPSGSGIEAPLGWRIAARRRSLGLSQVLIEEMVTECTEIAARRRSLGLSQRRLADILGIDQGTVSGWERGRVRPTRRLRRIFELWLAESVLR